MKVKLYDVLWTLGEMSGCHQLPERSIFIKGKQMPVCARCSGAFLGYLFGLLISPVFQVAVWICILLCLIMFVDWFVQHKGWKQSSNIRRFITGTLCGFGLMQLYLWLIQCIIELL